LLSGTEPNDEIITASLNNIADFQAILATGANPVFCDVDDSTLCIDPAQVEQLIGSRTRAIIAMDYACHSCDHDALSAIARRHGLRLIHDAAHSIGSRYNGQPMGSFADYSIFSFDPVKIITAIDGGAIVVNDEAELMKVHAMRLLGMGQPAAVMYQNQRAWTYDVERLGFRYHLANLHAAIGAAQLAKFQRIARTRRESFAYYVDNLRDLPALLVPSCDLENTVPFIFYVRVFQGRREALRTHLMSRGVDTGIHWQPGHRFSLFRNCRKGPLGVTEHVATEILTLPLHSDMDRGAQDRVIEALGDFHW
jgi:dTDP-4-amino-4,6-dideoxygalactose transaminase